MLKVNNVNPEAMIRVTCGATPLVKGEIATWSSNTAIPGTEGIATAIILGVVAEDTAAAAIALIYPVSGVEIEADVYQGGATDTFSATDVGKLFDVYVASNDFKIDPNDTDGAFCMLTRYDNDTARAWFRIPQAYVYLS
jgi:hypothetical protein